MFLKDGTFREGSQIFSVSMAPSSYTQLRSKRGGRWSSAELGDGDAPNALQPHSTTVSHYANEGVNKSPTHFLPGCPPTNTCLLWQKLLGLLLVWRIAVARKLSSPGKNSGSVQDGGSAV